MYVIRLCSRLTIYIIQNTYNELIFVSSVLLYENRMKNNRAKDNSFIILIKSTLAMAPMRTRTRNAYADEHEQRDKKRNVETVVMF